MGTQARRPSISSFLQTKAKDIDDKRAFTFFILNKEIQERGYRRSLASLGRLNFGTVPTLIPGSLFASRMALLIRLMPLLIVL